MFRKAGHDQGFADGRADALLGRKSLPRHNVFGFGLISRDYLDAYFEAYKRGYQFQQNLGEKEALQKKHMRTKNPLKDIFECGWEDGYDGMTPTAHIRNEKDIRIYQRGFRQGQMARDYERSKEIQRARRAKHKENLSNAQARDQTP